MYSVINLVLIYAEADKDSTEGEKTETEQPALKFPRGGPTVYSVRTNTETSTGRGGYNKMILGLA